MPSSRDYSYELGINFNTVARVYKELENEKILFTKRGLGTFITESKEQIERFRDMQWQKTLIATFVEGMEQLGYSKKDMIKFIEIQYNNIERIE